MAAALFASGAAMAAEARVRHYQGVALSPDGSHIAAVEQVEQAGQTTLPHGVIVLRSETGTVLATYDPCGACRYAGLAYAPNGRAIAFVASDGKAGTAALDVIENGKVRTVAVVQGVAQTPRWSPDGRTLAVLATVGAHKEIGATQAGKPLTGEIGSDVDEQRIAVVPASGGALRLISPADTWVYEYDWRPDGRGFVATAAQGDGDDNWWIAKLVAADLSGGGFRTLAAPSVQMNFPRASPDGGSVAFIGGLMSDFGAVGGDLYLAPLGGGAPRDVTPGFKGTFTSVAWRGGKLIATALVGDRFTVETVDPATGAIDPAFAAPVTASAGDGEIALSADGERMAFAAQTFETAPYLDFGPIATPTAITHDNDAAPPHVAARSVSWTSDGSAVQGWLLSPRKIAPGKTYPMITLVHGGPSSATTPTYIAADTVRDLVDHGYLVFEPNPRGSYGQGEAFTRANVRDLGGGDLRDILAGVDAVEKIAPVDDRRLGVMGHSYGGFMTMWTVTHTDRFHAAVAGAGLSNWISYYGENGIDKWMIPFFGASAYDDPAIYDKLSPIRYIKNAKTPTFIYVGERDVECPAPQSIEFWHGLKAMDVPTSLVIYAGEGHGIRKPADLQDRTHRILDWFDRYLKPES
jgi:dipeptidyl aminopeptidase/acylaminoacyl peptidase